MSRAAVLTLVVVAVLALGLFLPWVMRGREAQNRLYCTNNLRELAKFAAVYADDTKQNKPVGIAAIPAGTLVNPTLTPEQRLSWVPAALPLFNQRRQPTEELTRQVNPTLGWDADAHAGLRATKLNALLCPAAADVSAPVTHYVAMAGLGADAATLSKGDPRAGCFRYDEPTPLEFIRARDGLSQSLLFGETAHEPGAWLRGGPATVRGLLDGTLIGPGGQFGGHHAGGANFAFADGSVRYFTEATSPKILRAFATIAGGADELGAD